MREQLTCRVDKTFDSNESVRDAWDRFVVEVCAPIYMSYDWVRLWWQFYGNNHGLRVFVFSNGDSIVGIVPVYLTRIGFGPFRIRVARLVGANIPARIFNPPIQETFADEIWYAVLNRLFVQERCDVVSLGPLCETYAALEGLRRAAARGETAWDGNNLTQRDVHTTYHLPRTFNEFFGALDGKERKIRRKKMRDLEAKGPLRVEIVKEPAATEREFETFTRQHTTQWEAEGRPGHFHAWPRALEYHRELVKVQSRLGRTRFVRLRVGDEIVANQYTYGFGRTLFAELPARATGTEWDRLSLGCSSQVKLIEAAITEGFEKMESGLGHYDYKVLLGGREHRALTMRAQAPRAASRIKIRGCSMMRDLMTVLAQKIWYRRISPHLPRHFRSGQSEITLTYDF